jgi:hypothetical protein
MKILVLFLIPICFSIAQAQNSHPTGYVKKGLKFKTVEIARGDIEFASKELFVFEFINTSKTPVIIDNVQTSCGCTTAEKPMGEIKKRGKGKISVSYDTYRVGPFTKTITVTSNVGLPVVLTITGNVLPEKH